MFTKKVCFLFFLFVFFNNNISADLLSHKALYTLNVQNIKEGSFLEGGQGQTSFEIKKTCEGWTVKEDYVLFYELPSKKTSTSFSTYSTFENFSGTKHSFELSDKSDFEGEIFYEGFLEKNKNKVTGSIIKNNIKSLSFSNDVLFPIEHLRMIIKKAKLGEKFYTTKVFFGNEENKLVKTVSVFIGNEKKTNTLGFSSLVDKTIWPIKVALYSDNSRSGDPDYDIKIHLDQSGIAHYYEVNYGDFQIYASLKSFKLIDEKNCK